MNEVRARSPRARVVVRAALGALFAVATWFVVWNWTYVSGEIVWTCWGNGCGTDDLRVLWVVLGVLLAVVACGLLVSVLRLTGFGLVLGLAPLAAVRGWEASFADGRVDVLSGQVGFWRVLAIVGAVLAVLGLVVELRRPGPSWLLFGREWKPADAARTPRVGARPAPASLSTELARLAVLHEEGHLTDAEFEQAKRRVLNG